jgi:hypothetical protein
LGKSAIAGEFSIAMFNYRMVNRIFQKMGCSMMFRPRSEAIFYRFDSRSTEQYNNSALEMDPNGYCTY